MSMHLVIYFAVLLATANGLPDRKIVPLLAVHSKTAVQGHYIVVFNDNVLDKDVEFHHSVLRNLMSNFNGSVVKSMFHIGSFRGYSAKMDDKLLQEVRQMSEIKYIEADQVVETKCTTQNEATWGIVRTTNRDRSSSSNYNYDSNCAGYGVDVYIIDTGIETSHSDFNGRAKWGSNFVDSSGETDLNGHGTHCAGTIMADTWGIAKKATAIAVQVLDENGSGYVSGVVSGISWVVTQHNNKGGKSVANLSLGGGYSSSLNNAVDAAVSEGVHMIVAAGNEMTDACYRSPSSSQYCITVGASDSADDFAYFSNYGNCVNIIAPGVYITSTWINNGVASLSGTSMAAPHVAGVVAKILSCNNYSPSEMKSYLQKIGTSNMIQGLPYDTENILVYKGCDD